MRIVDYASWPFLPLESRTIEETDQWWRHCYLSGEAGDILPGGSHWRVIAGRPGSGKSAAIIALEKRFEDKSLVVRYPLERWPESDYARQSGGNHLSQIMATISVVIRDILGSNPAKIEQLSPLQREFVRWLLEKFDRPRAFARWLDGLPLEAAELFADIEYKDIYSTTDDPLDIQGQVDETTRLIQKIGYSQVLVTIDLNYFEAQEHLDSLVELFRWLKLIHHPGMRLVIALPDEIVEKSQLRQVAPKRLSLVQLTWEKEQVREIAIRHVRQAINEQNIIWSDLITTESLDEIETMVIEEFNGFVPLAWVAFSESILYLATRVSEPRSLPLGNEDLSVLKQTFYARHIPLRLDEKRQGVWRGAHFIKMTGKPFKLLQILERRGDRTIFSDDDLLALAGTHNNIHSLASRARKQLEPFPSNPVYIVNNPGGGGYRLYNCK